MLNYSDRLLLSRTEITEKKKQTDEENWNIRL